MKSGKSKINGTPKANSKSSVSGPALERAVDEAKEILRQAPTLAQVRDSIERDMLTAIYTFSLIQRDPTLLDKMAEHIYIEAQKSPQQLMEEQQQRLEKIKLEQNG